MAKPSLAGLKILVTRPRDQALPLAQLIESAGGKALLFPLLDIAPVLDADALQQQISHLPLANLAIFISPNAVQYGLKALSAAGISINAAENTGLKIATVGLGSAKALREQGVANVLLPEANYDSEGLLALPQLQAIAGWRVMIFRGDGGRELLGDTLKARGASVEYLGCYRRSKPQQSASCLLNELPDAITVTSSEALSYFWQMLDDAAQIKLRDIPIFLPHPRIKALAQTQGWRQVHLTESGDEGLLAGLQDWVSRIEDRKRPSKGNL